MPPPTLSSSRWGAGRRGPVSTPHIGLRRQSCRRTIEQLRDTTTETKASRWLQRLLVDGKAEGDEPPKADWGSVRYASVTLRVVAATRRRRLAC